MAKGAGSPGAPPGDVPGFEDALARLEKIVETMEGGDLPLEESLRLFEEGVGLARQLEDRLRRAEIRIETLVRGTDGGETSVPFDAPADEP